MGFDIPRGGRILSKGDMLGPAELGLLSTAGVAKVTMIEQSLILLVLTLGLLIGSLIIPLDSSIFHLPM